MANRYDPERVYGLPTKSAGPSSSRGGVMSARGHPRYQRGRGVPATGHGHRLVGTGATRQPLG